MARTIEEKARSIEAGLHQQEKRCVDQPLDAKNLRVGVSVIVPVFNERECTTQLLESLADLESQLRDQYDFEFLLVDDGSNDGTAEMLNSATEQRESYTVLRHRANRGIAAAIQTGLRYAQHEYVVSIDGDGSYDPMLIDEMLPRLSTGVDLVTASPYHPQGAVVNVPAWRLHLSRLASALYRLVMRRKLHCYTSCYRVYRRSAARNIVIENRGYVGVAELLWQLDRQGSHIVEHPAVLRSRVAGVSKMRIFRSALGHLHLIAQIGIDRIKERLLQFVPKNPWKNT